MNKITNENPEEEEKKVLIQNYQDNNIPALAINFSKSSKDLQSEIMKENDDFFIDFNKKEKIHHEKFKKLSEFQKNEINEVFMN